MPTHAPNVHGLYSACTSAVDILYRIPQIGVFQVREYMYTFIYTDCLGMYTLATLIGRRIDALSPNLRENLSERSFDTWA